VTSHAASAAKLSASRLGGRDGEAATAGPPGGPDGETDAVGGPDEGTARISPATYGLSRAMTRRWRTLPRTPDAAARSARLTATFTSTWLSPWQAAGTAVTVT
jgi:hypothetical protein